MAFAILAAAGCLALGIPAARGAEDPPTAEEIGAALMTLRTEVELERGHLERSLASHDAVDQRREDVQTRLAEIHTRIAARVKGTSPDGDEEPLEALEGEAEALEALEASLWAKLRALRRDIGEARIRIGALQERIAALRRSAPAEPESLSGTWDVTFLPSGDKGVFTLRQAGTLVSGEYTQEGGWRGSLQGTFVNSKLLLHRIDSKLGQSGELEGTVSPDLRSIKGSWQNRVLSDGSPSSGAWTGRKREPRRRGEGTTP